LSGPGEERGGRLVVAGSPKFSAQMAGRQSCGATSNTIGILVCNRTTEDAGKGRNIKGFYRLFRALILHTLNCRKVCVRKLR
jgi:hypothetical protein